MRKPSEIPFRKVKTVKVPRGTTMKMPKALKPPKPPKPF
jgi:hypothetical protein